MKIKLLTNSKPNVDNQLHNLLGDDIYNSNFSLNEKLKADSINGFLENSLLLIHPSDEFWSENNIELKKDDGNNIIADNLEYLFHNLNLSNTRIILFSDGLTEYPNYSTQRGFDNLRNKYSSIVEGYHWVFLDTINMLNNVNWKNLSFSDIFDHTNISEYILSDLPLKMLEHLLPIDILCQGAMIKYGETIHKDVFIKWLINCYGNDYTIENINTLPFSDKTNHLLKQLNFPTDSNEHDTLEKILGDSYSSNISQLWTIAHSINGHTISDDNFREPIEKAHDEYNFICALIIKRLDEFRVL